MDIAGQNVGKVARGALRSWTMWFSLLLAAFGAVQANLEHIRPLCGSNPAVYGYLTMGIAVMVAVLRIITTTSLADKVP